MLTPRSLPAGARQLAPRPGAWHALFSATQGSSQRPKHAVPARGLPFGSLQMLPCCLESRPSGFFVWLLLNVHPRSRLFPEAFPNPTLQWKKWGLKAVSGKGPGHAVCERQSHSSTPAWFEPRTLCFPSLQLGPHSRHWGTMGYLPADGTDACKKELLFPDCSGRWETESVEGSYRKRVSPIQGWEAFLTPSQPASCVTLGKSLQPSEQQLLHLYNRDSGAFATCLPQIPTLELAGCWPGSQTQLATRVWCGQIVV